MHAKSLQSCSTLCDPWTVFPLGFSRQEYWNGLPYPPPGDLPDLGLKPESLMASALASGFFTTSTTREAFILLPSYLNGADGRQHKSSGGEIRLRIMEIH